MRSETLTQAASARWLFVAGAILFGAAVGPVWSSGVITGIDVCGKADRVVITVQGDSALSFVPIASAAGKYLGFQFPRALAMKGRVVPVRSGGIYNVRYTNFRPSPPITRIVVNTTSRLGYATQWSPDRKRVEIHVMKKGVKAAVAAPKPASNTEPAPAPAGKAATTPPEKATTTAPPEPAPPGGKVQASDPPAAERAAGDGLSAYSAIAAKSRQPRIAAKVTGIQDQPVPAPVAAAPAPVAKADPPAPEQSVQAPRPAPRAQAVRAGDGLSAYSAIAAKSRQPRVAATSTISESQPVAQLPTANSRTAAEPTVRVMGMVETSPAAAEVAGPAEPKPRVTVEVSPTSPPRVAVTVPVKLEPAKSERKVSLNFLAADINDVLKALSVQSGRNIVAGKDVTGNVTVSLSNVGLEEALDYVAKLSGYTYTKDNDTYLVSSKESLRTLTSGSGPDSKTELVKLSYAKADDVMVLLKARFPDVAVNKVGVELTGRVGTGSKAGQTGVGLKNNLLVLVGPTESVAAARELAEQFENTLRAQTIESTRGIYRIKYVNATELADTLATLIPGIGVAFAPTEGFDLQGPKGISLESSGASVAQDDSNKVSKEQGSGQGATDTTVMQLETTTQTGVPPRSRVASIETKSRPQALIIVGRDPDVKKALELAAELDIKSPQIKIDAKITSINESGEKKLGISWDWGQFVGKEGFTDFDKTVGTTPAPANRQNVQIPHSAWFKQPWDFAATLEALIKSGDGQLLASPSLVCMEGKPGVFFVGDDVTYIVRVETTPTGQNVLTETKQVGVQLRVIGDVSPDGCVTLNLHPEVSVLKLTQDAAAAINLPIISRRFTDHVIRVKSGETIVIGGLIRNDEIDEMSKVPFLGDVPLFGHLFRHKQKTKDHTEVVMFITASILQD